MSLRRCFFSFCVLVLSGCLGKSAAKPTKAYGVGYRGAKPHSVQPKQSDSKVTIQGEAKAQSLVLENGLQVTLMSAPESTNAVVGVTLDQLSPGFYLESNTGVKPEQLEAELERVSNALSNGDLKGFEQRGPGPFGTDFLKGFYKPVAEVLKQGVEVPHMHMILGGPLLLSDLKKLAEEHFEGLPKSDVKVRTWAQPKEHLIPAVVKVPATPDEGERLWLHVPVSKPEYQNSIILDFIEGGLSHDLQGGLKSKLFAKDWVKGFGVQARHQSLDFDLELTDKGSESWNQVVQFIKNHLEGLDIKTFKAQGEEVLKMRTENQRTSTSYANLTAEKVRDLNNQYVVRGADELSLLFHGPVSKVNMEKVMGYENYLKRLQLNKMIVRHSSSGYQKIEDFQLQGHLNEMIQVVPQKEEEVWVLADSLRGTVYRVERLVFE